MRPAYTRARFEARGDGRTRSGREPCSGDGTRDYDAAVSSDATALHARSRWVALVRFQARRLRSTPLGRFAFFASSALSVVAATWVVVLRVEDGASAPTAAVPVRVARMAFWLVALPVVLAAASSRMLADRKDGVEALARTSGFGSGAIVRARIAAAAAASAVGMAIPALVAAVASLGAAPSTASLSERALVLAAVLAYAVVSGSAAGALGAVADVLSPRRGRSLLLTVTFVSWALADVASEPRLSVTGLLGLVLKQLLAWLGLGRIGA
jgi:hypothetical protein